MATVNGKKVNVSVEPGTKGYDLSDLTYNTPASVKAKIHAAQVAVKALLDMGNGEGNNCVNAVFDQAYKFYNFLDKFVCDLPNNEVRGYHFVEVQDFSDVPFIRVMDEDYCTKDFKVTPAA